MGDEIPQSDLVPRLPSLPGGWKGVCYSFPEEQASCWIGTAEESLRQPITIGLRIRRAVNP